MPNVTQCPTCNLKFEDDPKSRHRCIAEHAEGVCCHVSQILVPEDGMRQRAVPWPDCVLVEMRWITAEMICAICSRRWTANYPETQAAIECAECGHMNARRDELAREPWQ